MNSLSYKAYLNSRKLQNLKQGQLSQSKTRLNRSHPKQSECIQHFLEPANVLM